ncbi:ABC transporter permease [Sulfodiicoccus acidiphilus]|uniref:ABC transporter permease n=1 Tax=Sulfodiicoccus acidiphilus TaxID=1670455 RepID=A0A348B695_9CREN|nr:glucose ABC transporter permease GlcU [Sulfodiicoccus acidiphilus]BBD73697.1 ABC transporter permease [Sulfodiicoccus acidiphilus]GGT97718.1 ABC transporter permease [Sulfodiicoccus acidiphilus]
MSEFRIGPTAKAFLHQLILAIFVVAWVVPIYAMAINGLKSEFDVTSTPVFIPPLHPSLAAFASVWSELNVPLLNSIIVVIPVSVIATFIGAMAAYYFYILSTSKSKSLGILSNTIFSLIALATFMPYQAVVIPLTRIEANWGLLNTYGGVIFAFSLFYIPTAALLMSMFMAVLPRDIIDASRIDGSSDLRTFFKIVVPLTVPGLISTLIFNIIEMWNNFFIPLVLFNVAKQTLIPVAVESFTGGYGTLYNDSFAAAFLASIIPLLIFIFLGRYFIRGLVTLGTGGKGAV